MKTIYVGFSYRSGFNPLSSAIKLVEGSQYSHTYLKIQLEGTSKQIVFQASGLVVNMESLDNFNAVETVVKEFPLIISEDLYKQILEFAVDTLGTPYGMKELVGLGLMKLFNLKDNPLASGNTTYICVKLAAKVVEILGIQINKSLDSVDLNDLYAAMENNTKWLGSLQ